MKKIEDYLHLYLGCECKTPDGVGKLHSISLSANGGNSNRVHIFFGKMVKTINSIDGGYNKVRNHGDYAIEAMRYEPIGSEGATEDGFDMPGGVIPILRTLSDMSEEEKEAGYSEWQKGGTSITKQAAEVKYLLSKHFDLFYLIEAGLAIDATTVK